MKNRGYLLTDTRRFQFVTHEMSEEPALSQVLLKIMYCGICGGDYSCYIGRRPEYPKSLGHEFVGKIVSTGDGVSRVQPGDQVVSDLNYRCGKCAYCLKGQSHLCIENNVEHFTNRAFFEYMIIEETYLHKIETNPVFLYRATLIEPLSCVLHSLSGYDLTDKNILINGCGSIGTLACFYMKDILGVHNISVYDSNEVRSEALSSVMRVNKITRPRNENFDFVYECTNSPLGVSDSLRCAKRNGEVCVLSHIYGEESSFIYESICKKELRPKFPLRNGPLYSLGAADACLAGFWRNDYDRLLGIYDFKKLPEVFARKERLPENKQIIKVTY